MRMLAIIDGLLHLMVGEKLERQKILVCRRKEDFLKDYDSVFLQQYFLTYCDHQVEVIRNFFVGLINYYDTFEELLEHLL